MLGLVDRIFAGKSNYIPSPAWHIAESKRSREVKYTEEDHKWKGTQDTYELLTEETIQAVQEEVGAEQKRR